MNTSLVVGYPETIASRLLRIAGYSCEKASKEPMQE